MPIIVNIYAFYIDNDKKFYFAVYFYKNLKIISGFLTKRKSGGFYLHLKNNAKIITFKWLDFKSSSGVLKAFSVDSINVLTSVSVDKPYLIFIIQSVFNFIKGAFMAIKSNNDEFNGQSNLNVYLYDNDVFNVGVYISTKTNVLRIILALISNAIIKGRKKIEKLKN